MQENNIKDDSVYAPFTDKQLQNIRDWQQYGAAHPLTCAGSVYCQRKGTCYTSMLAYKEGLICACGKTRQTIVPIEVCTFDLQTLKKTNDWVKSRFENSPNKDKSYDQVIAEVKEAFEKITPEDLKRNELGIRIETILGTDSDCGFTNTDQYKQAIERLENYLLSDDGQKKLSQKTIKDSVVKKIAMKIAGEAIKAWLKKSIVELEEE